ncbi:hypothetical protein ACFE04_011919 [Oxalis oulophora]
MKASLKKLRRPMKDIVASSSPDEVQSCSSHVPKNLSTTRDTQVEVIPNMRKMPILSAFEARSRTCKLVAIKPKKEERIVKGLNELLEISKIESMLHVAFNHVRDHTTPIDVKDKVIDGLILVLVSKVLELEALCARDETDASSSIQLVTERDQALGVAQFDVGTTRAEVEAMRVKSETLTKYLAEAQASLTVVESSKKENTMLHKAYGR